MSSCSLILFQSNGQEYFREEWINPYILHILEVEWMLCQKFCTRLDLEWGLELLFKVAKTSSFSLYFVIKQFWAISRDVIKLCSAIKQWKKSGVLPPTYRNSLSSFHFNTTGCCFTVSFLCEAVNKLKISEMCLTESLQWKQCLFYFKDKIETKLSEGTVSFR